MIVRFLVAVVFALMVLLALTCIGDDRHPLAIEATPATFACNPTIPPRLARQATRNWT